MLGVPLKYERAALLCFLNVTLLTLSQCFDEHNSSSQLINNERQQQAAKRGGKEALPYSSAEHYWPLNKIEKNKNRNSVKDLRGGINAVLSEGVKTKYDDQLGPVVSLSKIDDSIVMNPLKSTCISDPSVTLCRRGITVEFWLKFRKGECILSSGGYTKRLVGPGFELRYDRQKKRLVLQLSTTSKLWRVELNVKKSVWVHLMFTWKEKMGLMLYENGKFLTRAKTFDKVRYPSLVSKYRTLTVGAKDNLLKLKSGSQFDVGHLVIWTRSLSAKQIRNKAFLLVVRQSVRSIVCCRRKYEDPCISNACFYQPRCNNIDEKYKCICPNRQEATTCREESSIYPCRDTADDCSTLAQQPNYCNYYAKQMRSTCSESCQFCRSSPMVRWTTGQSDDDYKIMTVAIALGVSCVVMLLIIIAIVMARINSKWQGEFIPGDNLNGTITPDHNTQEMIAASVDPAPRITDVPYKSPKAKKATTMNLKRPEYMTSEI